MTEKKKLIIVGPLPPPFTGMSVVTEMLLNSTLFDRFEVVYLNTSDKRPIGTMGKFDLINIVLALYHSLNFIRLCLIHDPDLVYLPISQNFLGFLRDSFFLIPCRILKIKVVIHLNGGHFRNFYNDANFLMKRIIEFSLARISAAIVLGKCLKHIFKGLVDEDKIFIVPNGIEDNFYGYQRKPCDNGTFKILFLSNLIKEKGVLEVIRVVRPLVLRYKKLKFLFAGEWGDKKVKREALELIRRDGIEDYVEFLGIVRKNAKKKLLEETHLFVLPTFYPFEGQPLTLLEAMSASLPVITTAKGAIAETIKDGENGFLVRINDLDELEKRITEFIHSPDLCERMGRLNRKIYLENYTKDIFIDNLCAVLMQAAKEEIVKKIIPVLEKLRKILVVGYLPPPQEGTAKITEIIIGSAFLRDRFNIAFLSLKKRVDVVNRGKFGLSNISNNLSNTLNYLKLIIRFGPEVIHMPLAQNIWGFFRDSMLIFFGKLFRRKIYAHFHGGSFDLFYAMQNNIFKKYIIFTLQRIDLLILLADKFTRQFSPFIERKKITYLYNCVSETIDIGDERHINLPNIDKVKILFIGYLSKAKGALDLVQAVPHVVANYKKPIEFILCGQPVDIERNIVFISEPHHGYSRIINFIKQRNISRYITIKPEVQLKEKARLLSEANIFVFPSYSEGCGLVALEAMGYGLPLIVSPVGALEEMLVEGQNCLFVNPGDIKGLTDKLLFLLNNPQLCREMGERNRNIVIEKYNPDVYVNNLADIWDKAMQS